VGKSAVLIAHNKLYMNLLFATFVRDKIVIQTLNHNRVMSQGFHYYPSQDPLRKLERELRIRGFSQKTIKAYLYYNRKFLEFTRKSPKNICNEDIKKYVVIVCGIVLLLIYLKKVLILGIFKNY
jgi:hypothetical protein